jgi:hypothetical protein
VQKNILSAKNKADQKRLIGPTQKLTVFTQFLKIILVISHWEEEAS